MHRMQRAIVMKILAHSLIYHSTRYSSHARKHRHSLSIYLSIYLYLSVVIYLSISLILKPKSYSVTLHNAYVMKVCSFKCFLRKFSNLRKIDEKEVQ